MGNSTSATPHGHLHPQSEAYSAAEHFVGQQLRDEHVLHSSQRSVDHRARQAAGVAAAADRIVAQQGASYTLPVQRARPQRNVFDERERYLLELEEKHSQYPSSFRGYTSTARKHYRPLRNEVERDSLHPDGPVITEFERYRPGNFEDDQQRARVRSARYRAHDGSIDHEGMLVETYSTGVQVPARQSAYEALMSRPTHAIRRELEALKDTRNVTETRGRVVATDWQGPEAAHRPSAATGQIGRRQVETGPLFHGVDGTQVYHQPFQSAETVMRPTLPRSFEGRREVTGAIARVERPMIDNSTDNQRVRKPAVYSLRVPNATDVSTYVGASTVFGNRTGQLETTSFREEANESGQAQRPVPGVSDNRATRQMYVEHDSAFETRELQTGNYTARTGVSHTLMAPQEYQRQMQGERHFEKIVVDGYDPQPLRFYDQQKVLHRNMDNPPRGMYPEVVRRIH